LVKLTKPLELLLKLLLIVDVILGGTTQISSTLKKIWVMSLGLGIGVKAMCTLYGSSPKHFLHWLKYIWISLLLLHRQSFCQVKNEKMVQASHAVGIKTLHVKQPNSAKASGIESDGGRDGTCEKSRRLSSWVSSGSRLSIVSRFRARASRS
jgi:hypothetical protein